MVRQTQKWALGVAALAALGSLGTLVEVGPVESDLTRRAAAALGGVGLAEPALLMSGRDALISGEAASPDARRAALDAVAGVWGVRSVEAGLVWIRLGAGAGSGAPAPRAGPGWLGYDFSFLWPWLLPAAALGAAVARPASGAGRSSARRGRALALWSGAASIALAAGIVVAATRWPPGRPAFWLEAAALFAASFCVGGVAVQTFPPCGGRWPLRQQGPDEGDRA
jgi:hypothetical protein